MILYLPPPADLFGECLYKLELGEYELEFTPELCKKAAREEGKMWMNFIFLNILDMLQIIKMKR